MPTLFEPLLHQYIPLAQKSAFLEAHPQYKELQGKEISDDATVTLFVQTALAYLDLLGTGIKTEHHDDGAAPVAVDAANPLPAYQVDPAADPSASVVDAVPVNPTDPAVAARILNLEAELAALKGSA